MIRVFPLIAPYSNISGYGMRGTTMHDAVDLGCPPNTIVVAADDGTVSYAVDPVGGNVAVLHCPDGSAIYMAHLRDVQTGSRNVKAGDAIAVADTTGNAAGGPTHLHLQLWADGSFAGPHPDPTSQLLAATLLAAPVSPTIARDYTGPVLAALGILGVSGALAWAISRPRAFLRRRHTTS